MAVKLYRIAWQRYSAHIRTADAALVAQLGRFLDLKPGIEETEPPGAVENLITIEDANGRDIPGTPQFSKNETQWSFMPTSQWPSGDFRVRVDWELEDLAGNNLLRLFEMDVAQADAPVFAGPRYLRFHLK